MSNRRNNDRSPSFLGATIIYNRDRWSAPCVVKNLSRNGVRIMVRGMPTLPERFHLAIPSKKITYAVRTAWRDGDTVGLEIKGVVAVNETAVLKTQARVQARQKPEPADLGI